MKKSTQLMLLITGWLILSSIVNAEIHTIKGVGIQFKPSLVFANPGDNISFRDMPTHFVNSIDIPEGAKKMFSQMGANYDYKVTEPGIYLYNCPPHWGARMGGLIFVGSELRNEENLISSLTELRNTVSDNIAKGYLKKIIKNIKKGKIKVP